MNKVELLEIARRERFRDDAYDLTGGHRTETYTLSESYGRWFVYYSERGLERDKKQFGSESDALEYLLQLLRKDPTVRLLPPPQ